MERKIAKRPGQVVVKRQLGFAKTRYRDPRKTANALTVLFAPVNVAM